MSSGSIPLAPYPSVNISTQPRRWLSMSHPTFWCFAYGVFAFLMVALKTDQRMIQDHLGLYEADWNALQTRGRNHSFCIDSGYSATIILVSLGLFLLRRHPFTKFQFSPRVWIGAALLTAYYWTQYLHAIAVAPDPGTFWSKYHGELYLIQCVEGVLNLAVFASAAVFIAAAFAIMVRRDLPTDTAVCIAIAAISPALVYALFTRLNGFAWLMAGWGQGNPSIQWIYGYTSLQLAPNALLALLAAARLITRIKFVRWVIEKIFK